MELGLRPTGRRGTAAIALICRPHSSLQGSSSPSWLPPALTLASVSRLVLSETEMRALPLLPAAADAITRTAAAGRELLMAAACRRLQ